MLNTLLEKVGLQWTLRIWAIMTCTTTGAAFLVIRPRVPIVKRRPGQARPRFIVPQMQYFKSPLFLSFVRLSQSHNRIRVNAVDMEWMSAVAHLPRARALLLPRLALHRVLYAAALHAAHRDDRPLALQLVLRRRPGHHRPPHRPDLIPLDHGLQRDRQRTRRVLPLGLRRRRNLPILLRGRIWQFGRLNRAPSQLLPAY